ncbi:uncharacterized protein LOC121609277 [Chelmon rostratus]|uniref:uncharacterized protein LOC121609277 n=1 Tax=Chelmon rostratus TaxID=109905 RepID=UPI001BEC6D13|nr:uncharacterized protein LOC121609277 [Chelmon rostratus]
MHQLSHQHAFAPVLQQPSTVLPAPPGPRDSKFNMHLPRGTSRPSFVPVTVFHRSTQRPFRSTKRGRWGALHVCIAWKIYYHEQHKKMQTMPDGLTAEHPSTSLPVSAQHKESDQPAYRHKNLDPPCERSGKMTENAREFNRSYPSDLHTSLPLHGHKRETLEQPSNLRWKEKAAEETHRGQQTDRAKDLPLRDKSWDPAVELDGRRGGSVDRKRPLECDSFMKQ